MELGPKFNKVKMQKYWDPRGQQEILKQNKLSTGNAQDKIG